MADPKAFPGLRSVLRNGLFFAGRSWTEALLRAVYALLIARVLGPADYGLWSLVMTAYMLGVTGAAIGMDLLISARLGRDRDNARAFLETSLALRLLFLAIVALGVAVIAVLGGQSPEMAAALAIITAAIFGRGLSMWTRPVFQGMERGETSFLITFLCRLLEVVIGLILLFATRDVLALLVLHSVSWLIEALISFWRARRVFQFGAPRFHGGEVRPLLAAALPIGIAIACNAALHAAPILMASAAGATRIQIGQLGIVVQFAAFAVMGMQAFLLAVVPVLARAIEREDARAPAYGAIVAAMAMAGFGTLAVLAHVFGEPLIVQLLGDDYLMAARLLPWGFVIGGLSVLPNGFWQYQALGARTRPGIIAGVTGVALAIAIATALWSTWALEGVLLAVACGWLARALILIAAVFQKPT